MTLSYQLSPPQDLMSLPALRPLVRAMALLLDVIIVGTPIAVLIVAGSFDTETSRRSFSVLDLIAVAVGVCYVVVEILCGFTPGLLIARGRIAARDRVIARRAQRSALKYGPFVIPYLAAVAVSFMSHSDAVTGITSLIAMAIIAIAGAILVASGLKSVLTNGRSDLCWDTLVHTRVISVAKSARELDVVNDSRRERRR